MLTLQAVSRSAKTHVADVHCMLDTTGCSRRMGQACCCSPSPEDRLHVTATSREQARPAFVLQPRHRGNAFTRT